MQFGQAGDIPLPNVDFDGDHKTDIGVYRPGDGTWFVLPSSNPNKPIIVQFGLPGDISIPNQTGK